MTNVRRTRESFRADPEVLAEVVMGSWNPAPSTEWSLRQLNSVRGWLRRQDGGGAQKGLLLYTPSPERDIAKLRSSGRDLSNIVLMTEGDAETPDSVAGALRVSNLGDSVFAIGDATRNEYAGRIIAVTGSMGKTTVQTLLSQVLAEQHSVYTRRSDLNGIRATRSRLLSLTDEDYAVFEVPRAILPGAEKVLRPDIAVITAIAEAHMEALGSLESTARRKAEILRGLPRDGTAVINRDAPFSDLIIEIAREQTSHVITYGTTAEADIRLLDYDPQSHTVTAETQGRTLSYVLGATGEHNALNSLSVIGVLQGLGLDPQAYLKTFEEFEPVQGRGKTTEVTVGDKPVTMIDQSFNANPASIRAALVDFQAQYQDRSRILILGDMKELGPESEALHADLVPDIVKSRPERVYLVGPLMAKVWANLPDDIRGAHTMTPQQLLRLIPGELEGHPAVLVKSSHDTGLYTLVEAWQENPADPESAAVVPQTWRVKLSGPAVQGVGLRRWIRGVARQRGVDGWVRNIKDGHPENVVEILVRGDRSPLMEVLGKVHHGSPGSSIRRVEAELVDVVPSKGFVWRKARTWEESEAELAERTAGSSRSGADEGSSEALPDMTEPTSSSVIHHAGTNNVQVLTGVTELHDIHAARAANAKAFIVMDQSEMDRAGAGVGMGDDGASEAIAAGADIVVTPSISESLTIDFLRRHPVIRLNAEATRTTDVSGPSWALEVREADSSSGTPAVHLRAYLTYPGQDGRRPATAEELSGAYQAGMSSASRSERFLEHVDSVVDASGAYLSVQVDQSGRVKNTSSTGLTVPAGWEENSKARFSVDARLLTTSRVLHHEMDRRGMEPESITSNFVVGHHDGSDFAYYLSSGHNAPYTAVKAVGNKQVARALLTSSGLSVARGEHFSDPREVDSALKMLPSLGSVVLKPVDGTKGKGVTVGVTSPEGLRQAWDEAFSAAKSGILLEQQFEGVEARFTVVGEDCVAVARRTPPTITGDGSSTVRELINAKNQERRRNPHLVNRPIILNRARVNRLAEHSLSLSTVLRVGRAYIIDDKAGFSTGAESVDITESIHPSYSDIAVNAMRAVPGLTVAGVDILVQDFDEPATPENHIIIELNSQPGLGGHHFPVHGSARNVAGAMIELDRRPRSERTFNVHIDSDVSPHPRRARGSDANALLLAQAFEHEGFRVTWLTGDYFHAEKGSVITNIWGSFTSLTGKSAIIATRHPKISHDLMSRRDIPMPRGRRVVPSDRSGRSLRNGAKALAHAASFHSATLRVGNDLPVEVDAQDSQAFLQVWQRLSKRTKHGIIVEERSPGLRFRFLIAYENALCVAGDTAPGSTDDGGEAVHESYSATAVRAVRAFPGLDLAEVTVAIEDPRDSADPSNHTVLAVRPKPGLPKFVRASPHEESRLAETIVQLHIAALTAA